MRCSNVPTSQAEAGTEQIRRFKELLTDHPQFRRSWIGSTISMLGSRTIGVTYPLLGYELTDSPAWIGWVMFASTVPALVAHIPAGAIIDWLGPRRVMFWSEVLRGVLIAGLCLLLLAGEMRVEYLVAIALVEGTLSAHSSVAETALIPTTVKPDDVERALAVHEGSVHSMVLTGRPLGGLLFGIAPIVSFGANAAMFFSAALILRRREPDITASGPRKERLLRQIGAGVVELWRDPFLRWATLVTAFINLMVQGLIMIFLAEAADDGLPAFLMGTILAVSGIGGVVGALIFPKRRDIWGQLGARAYKRSRGDWHIEWWRRRVPGPSTMRAHLWSCAVALLLPLVFLASSPVFAVSLLLIGLTGGLSNVTMRRALSQVPTDRVARVVGVSRLATHSAVAIGPLLASLLVQCAGSVYALAALAVPTVAAAVLMTFVPALRTALTSSGVEPESATPAPPAVALPPAAPQAASPPAAPHTATQPAAPRHTA